MTWMNRLAI